MLFPDNNRSFLAKVKQGDQDAWSGLFRLYNEPVCRFIGYLPFVDREDVHDVASGTWEKAWKARSGIDQVCNIKAWLCRIAQNTACDHYRKRKRREEKIRSAERWYLDDEPPDEIPDPGNAEEQVEVFLLLNQAWEITLTKITEAQKKCFLWHIGQGLSISEIAQMLNLTEGTVRVYIAVARKSFRDEYRSIQEGG